MAREAVRDERARIARELHDVLGHTLNLVVIQAGGPPGVCRRRSLKTPRTHASRSLLRASVPRSTLGRRRDLELGAEEGRECRKFFLRVTFNDYDQWKKVFDEADDFRRSHGVVAESVHRDVDDPQKAVVLLTVEDLVRLREAMGSPEFREIMQRAGIQGPPEVWLAEKRAQ